MKELSITELAGIIKAGPRPGTPGFIAGVSTDSRTVKPGDCFFAIKGKNFDGHNFLAGAFSKGAVCAVVSKDISADKFSDKVILNARDTIEALGGLAAWYRQDCSFKVIAITGSVGKTTTRQMICHVLGGRYAVHQSPKNYNNFIGVPLTLLGAKPSDQVVVAELGTNKPGEIGYLARIVRPDVAVITAVAPAHLEGFGDMNALTAEKLAIAEGLTENGVLIINGDCPQLVEQARKQRRKFESFGTQLGCNYRASNVDLKGLASQFRIADVDVQLGLPGSGNVSNALAAWAVCQQFGVRATEFAEAIKTTSAPAMRTDVVHVGSITIINDCYNANPASMKNALEILAAVSAEQAGRSVFVCGDMAELGSHSQEYHAELGRLVKQAGVKLLLTVGQFGAVVSHAAGLIQSRSFDSSQRLCENLEELISRGDIVLVKGSRINGLELVAQRIIDLFGQQSARGVSGAQKERR